MDRDPPADDAATFAKARARRAGNLLNTQRWEQALVEYDWVWRHLHIEAPDMAGVRLSFNAGEIGHLCREHPPAQAHFELIRAETEAAAGSRADDDADGFATRLDWMVLNEILGQADRTLIWFDQIDLGALPDAVVELCIPRLVPLLRRRGRWAEIGQLFRDPLAKLRADHATLLQTRGQKPNRPGFGRMNHDDLMADLFREQTTILVRGLRAAGRSDEADAVRDEAMRLDDSAEMRDCLAEIDAPASPPGT